jgi:hypothetical protein
MKEGGFMTISKSNGDYFIYSTTASPQNSQVDEFILELFDYTPNMACEGTPKIVIKNFDELIDFFETFE